MQTMKGILFVLLVSILLVTACSPGTGVDDVAQTPDEPGGEVPALSTVASTATSPARATPTNAPAATAEPEATEMDDEAVSTADPVEVDLGALTPLPTVVTTPQEAPLPGGIDPNVPLFNELRQDLADRLDIDISEVTVVESEEVEWRDSSLGCPEPGTGYLQVITPGLRVVLSALGNEYEYHTGRQGNYVLCVDGMPVPPGEAPPVAGG